MLLSKDTWVSRDNPVIIKNPIYSIYIAGENPTTEIKMKLIEKIKIGEYFGGLQK